MDILLPLKFKSLEEMEFVECIVRSDMFLK